MQDCKDGGGVQFIEFDFVTYGQELTNLPPFSMVCTLIYHRNDAIKN